jgi:hypothetical protein
MVEKEIGLRFFNYGEEMPGSEYMTVILEIDGEYAARYRGRYDGNFVRCVIDKRKDYRAPRRADVSPEYMINRRGQPLAPEHVG